MNSFYEGHSITAVTFPVRVLKLLGVETIVGKSLSDGQGTPWKQQLMAMADSDERGGWAELGLCCWRHCGIERCMSSYD